MLPAKGNPRRPLALAVMFTRLLGSACIVAMVLLLFLLASASPVIEFFTWWTIVIVLGLVLFVPAALYISFSFPLERKRKWAAVTLLVIASLQAVFMTFQLIRIVRGTWGEWSAM